MNNFNMLTNDAIKKWRFPVLFLGLIGILHFGFVNRKSFMQDLEEKRATMGVENEESKKLLETVKNKAKGP